MQRPVGGGQLHDGLGRHNPDVHKSEIDGEVNTAALSPPVGGARVVASTGDL